MSKNQKVVWYEGMNLDPHHFQQSDRFHQENLNLRIKSICNYDWGFIGISIAKDALENGQIKLLECSGIMPDGYAFRIPTKDPTPAIRTFTDNISSTQEKIAVYLTIPVDHPGGINYILDGSPEIQNTRYKTQIFNLNDETTGADSREIRLAKVNFQIKFEDESLEDLISLKIAEIVRTTDGGFALNKHFIPAGLTIDFSDTLIELVNSILELLITRSTDLLNRRSHSKSGNLEMNPVEMPIYWLLFIINSYIPLINQFSVLGKSHPAEVYSVLLSLAGQLTTLSTEEKLIPKNLPVYDHANSFTGFSTLEKIIRQLLSEITPTKNYTVIDLDKKGDNIYIGKVKDDAILEKSEIYLICSGELEESKFTNDLPNKMRIASPEMIKGIYELIMNKSQ